MVSVQIQFLLHHMIADDVADNGKNQQDERAAAENAEEIVPEIKGYVQAVRGGADVGYHLREHGDTGDGLNHTVQADVAQQ